MVTSMPPPDFLSLLKIPQLRWPKAGDRLFGNNSNTTNNAEISANADTRHQRMTNGYKEAADLLLARGLEEPPLQSALIYPTVYCYRHYLELTLKGFITRYGPSCRVQPPGRVHDLKKLLKSYRVILRACKSNAPNEMDISVSKCILEFHKFDERSFVFRYATDGDNGPYRLPLSAIDLERLRDTMDALENYFSGMDDYLFDLFSARP